jgi:glutamyl-tRNA synthetase
MSAELNTIISKIFSSPLMSLEDIFTKYPPRKLTEGAMVTRIAPSPTGFVHFGGLYAALISERFAHQTKGVFILRIEDTDKKREIAGTATLFASSLNKYGLSIDEGLKEDGTEIGQYGPYHQSQRAELYQAFAKDLIIKGLAYPCFASSEELEEMRARQEAAGERSGYWGHFAIWRDKSENEVLEALERGLKPVIRLKSPGNFNQKINIKDILLGSRELPENDQDIVILKSDGLPTYHFAHAIDDHLMGTTHVIRGNEWFPSLPLHIQLFQVLGWQPPLYAHLAPIQKIDEGKKRKLSKRHDPEANLEYYDKIGYPEEAVIEYLLNLANSNFEDWRQDNPDKNNQEFELSWKKLAKSNGPLFDLIKLQDISKELISKLDANTIYNRALVWAKKHNPRLAERLSQDPQYAKNIFNIERKDALKPRKDLAYWSNLESEISYFYDDLFIIDKEVLDKIMSELQEKQVDIKKIITDFISSYDPSVDQITWFEKLKQVGKDHNFALSMKELKEHPEKYRGQVGTIAQILRLLLTGRSQSPNLADVMKVLGKEKSITRLERIG